MTVNSLPQLGAEGRIVEGIVTSFNPDGTVNIAPMGPLVDETFNTLVLRPFHTSTTFGNLARTKTGVFHITDDVELFAQAAVGITVAADFCLDNPLVLADACRWYRFDVDSIDDSQERTLMVARTKKHGTLRDFLGFNRAKHAVIEAAILATRLHLLPAAEILGELTRLRVLIDKTGGAAEHRAFDFLRRHVEQSLAATACAEQCGT
jgi:uncharacterized protein